MRSAINNTFYFNFNHWPYTLQWRFFLLLEQFTAKFMIGDLFLFPSVFVCWRIMPIVLLFNIIMFNGVFDFYIKIFIEMSYGSSIPSVVNYEPNY